MAKSRSKSKPGWADVKAKLLEFDRPGLLDLIHDMYSAFKDNQNFLHARFVPGEGVLEPYKKAIERWIAPDVLRNQDISVATAKKAVADYKNAVGDPQGVAELMVFYCECAADFCADVGNDDEVYFGALVRIFEQALKLAATLPADIRNDLSKRLALVCEISDFGYGVKDDMNFLLSQYKIE
jgi:hypothetical protein